MKEIIENKKILVYDEDVSSGESITILKDFIKTKYNPLSVKTATSLLIYEEAKQFVDYFGMTLDQYLSVD